MKMMITGGAGFVGSHVVKRLQGDHDILIVDSLHPYYSPGWKQRRLNSMAGYKNIQWRKVDICNQEALEALYAFFQPDCVVHLAAIPGVQPSLEDPAAYVDVDVKGTVNLLSLAAKYQTSRFVFASSSSVYGAHVAGPSQEDEELQPVSPYAAAKAAGEMFCRTYQRLYNLPTTIVRPFTVYGPEQRPDMALWKFAMKIYHGEPIIVYKGRIGRDYTYVTDIADGIAKAALLPAARNKTYNLGNGKVVPIQNLVLEIENALERKAIIEWRDLPPGDVPMTWADTTRAEQELGFRAMVPITEGIRRFADWFLQEGVKR
jgi:UDP-glucuronate 4-epimerase